MTKILSNTLAVLSEKERKDFFVHILLGIVISVIDILALIALLWIIQLYVGSANSTIDWLPAWATDRHSLLPAGLFFLLFSIKNAFGYFIAKINYEFTGKVAIRLSVNNLKKYQQSPFSEFINTDSSSFIRGIAFQPFEFSQFVLSGFQQVISQLFLILISITAIVIFNAQLFFLLLLILLPPVVVVFYFVKNRMANAKKHLRQSSERSYQYLLDALKGYIEANIYQRNDFFLDRFIAQRKLFSHHFFHSLSLQNIPARVIEIFAVLGLFILVVIANWSGNRNTEMFITVGAFMAAAYKIIPGIVKVINTVGQMRSYEFSVSELMPEAKAIENNKDNMTLLPIRSIEVKTISFSYDDQSSVIKNLSFEAKSGDFLGISGVSGKGKTTLLNILLGLLKPQSGKLIINSEPLEHDEMKKIWPSVSYVRQQSFFIYDTILRNITFQEKGYDREKLNTALRFSGLDKLIETYPEGLEKIITENGKNISGGQQQRIAIARAVYKDADLVLLDEPFNQLDESSASSVVKNFKELAARGKIVIMITHDNKSLTYCNKIISLDEQ